MKISNPATVIANGQPAAEYINQLEVAAAHQAAATAGDNQSAESARNLALVSAAIYGKGPEFAQKVVDSIGHEEFSDSCILTAAQNFSRLIRGESFVPVLPNSMTMKINGVPVDWDAVFKAFQAIHDTHFPAGCSVEIVGS